MTMMLSPEALAVLPEEALREVLGLMEAQATLELREQASEHFLSFVHHVYEDFIEGAHHRIIAEKLELVAQGKIKRLIINMPPRHSKSELASYLLPSWFIGRNPKLKIIQATHNTDLAVRFGRKVRDLVAEEKYRRIFPDVHLKSDDKAAGKWSTSANGEYFAAGVGAAVTGRGADLFVIDDPHSEQDALNADVSFPAAFEWYTSGPRQRLQPGAAIVVVMCMTGDTPVLLPDGTERPLRDIRAGDAVATYDEGRLTTSRIVNHQSSGVDSVFKILTRSGIILRANERHPFLVQTNRGTEWTRLRDLKPGVQLVSLKGATGHLGRKPNGGFAKPVAPKPATTGRILTRLTERLGITANGPACHVPLTGATGRFPQGGFAPNTTTGSMFPTKLRNALGATGLNRAMASLLSSTTLWWWSAATSAMSAVTLPARRTLAHTGVASFASTTATTPVRYAGCSVMTATSLLDTEKLPQCCGEPPSTSSFTADEIISITYDGEEEVFDVEVERTENFIANGVVSHNTRWGKKDLTGMLLAAQANDPQADQWEVVEFPAILPSGNATWPEFWDVKELETVRANLPVAKWQAQWQQAPTSEEGSIIKREWWKEWKGKKIPACSYIMQSYDTAFSAKEKADFSAITTWGIFVPEEGGPDNIILLDARRGRWSFPELKEKAFEEHEYWDPDMVIVEAKATGQPLIDELRLGGIPAVGYSPGKGRDKVTRMHVCAPMFEAGRVWVPEGKRFAEEVIEEIASFPYGDNDDYADSTTMALMRFRQGGFVYLDGEEDDEEEDFGRKQREYY